jgi:hypothetical protein
MTHERKGKRSDDLSPVNVPICDSFDAELDQPVNFTGAPSGASISKSGSVWPFVDSNGNPYTDPIDFPLPSNSQIYIADDLNEDQSYPYNVNNAGCNQGVIKSVTIVDGTRMRKSA